MKGNGVEFCKNEFYFFPLQTGCLKDKRFLSDEIQIRKNSEFYPLPKSRKDFFYFF